MGYLNRLGAALLGRQEVQACASGQKTYSATDPRVLEIADALANTGSGAEVTASTAMRNTTVFRCVSLISYTMGMLPLRLHRVADKSKAVEHPLYSLLATQPNDWQSAFDFKALMQYRALVRGDAFALIVRSMGRVVRLVPLPSGMVTVKQNDDWTVEYRYQPPRGGQRVFKADEILHLRGLSEDGLRGLPLVRQAAEAIGLAMQAEKAAGRLFAQGMIVGGALKHPEKLSPEAYDRLKASIEARRGAEGAHKDLILEEGMEWQSFTSTSKDSQHLEMRAMQIEEIARVFGVPRPLLGVDDTSWGSGIDVLGQMFVRYGLAPWFTAWEQAIRRSALVGGEKAELYAKFNDGALLRGSMKDQSEFYAKALGSGGHHPWMAVQEIRDLMDLDEIDLSALPPAPGQRKETGDEPA
ncbi:phage portal protein [Paracoccus sp. (in: a-proteobacteria)]|uniref:phage portal protein n=1 Tax=Paracoccus sp. TaxID=267 RepID=UPI0028B0BEA5|nr:phage portal protein [Paracoccus sp. (in: a-proteobacteria)]